jgi:hypothetical protein
MVMEAARFSETSVNYVGFEVRQQYLNEEYHLLGYDAV